MTAREPELRRDKSNPSVPNKTAVVRQRLPAVERRAQILMVARDLFSREGIDETSMRNIAGRAGVSPAVLYRHFSDKDALLVALTESFFERLTAAMENALVGKTDAISRARALLATYLNFGIENPHEYRLTFMTALPRLRRGDEMTTFRTKARNGEPLHPETLTRGMVCFGMLEQTIADLVEGGHTGLKDIAALTEAVWAAGHGLVSLVITHDTFGWSRRDHLIETSITMMLNGLLRR